MIVGFRVLRICDGNIWAGRDSNEVLSEDRAIKELNEAGDGYQIVAVLKGEFQSPTFAGYSNSINNDPDLNALACEFNDEITLNSATRDAGTDVVDRLQQLVQRSTTQYSIVIPNKTQEIESGEGCGTWVGALVYIPNRELLNYNH